MKYTKPDLRVSPIWRCDPSGNIFQVRKDGSVRLLTSGDCDSASDWVRAIVDGWTPLVPYGQTPPDPPLVIEAGKWYETRGGVKAYVGYRREHNEHPFVGHTPAGIICWAQNGNYFASGKESLHDLIRETEAP